LSWENSELSVDIFLNAIFLFSGRKILFFHKIIP